MNGEKIPIRCTLGVLEAIQGEFGSLTKFSERLIPTNKKEDGQTTISGYPDVHAIVFSLPLFVDEGIDAWNEEHKIKIEKMTQKELFRRCDRSLIDVALAIYTEFWRSINAPKQSPPTETNHGLAAANS